MKQPIPEMILDLPRRRRLALDAEVDLRSLDKVLTGAPTRPTVRARVRRTLAAAGLLELLPFEEEGR